MDSQQAIYHSQPVHYQTYEAADGPVMYSPASVDKDKGGSDEPGLPFAPSHFVAAGLARERGALLSIIGALIVGVLGIVMSGVIKSHSLDRQSYAVVGASPPPAVATSISTLYVTAAVIQTPAPAAKRSYARMQGKRQVTTTLATPTTSPDGSDNGPGGPETSAPAPLLPPDSGLTTVTSASGGRPTPSRAPDVDVSDLGAGTTVVSVVRATLPPGVGPTSGAPATMLGPTSAPAGRTTNGVVTVTGNGPASAPTAVGRVLSTARLTLPGGSIVSLPVVSGPSGLSTLSAVPSTPSPGAPAPTVSRTPWGYANPGVRANRNNAVLVSLPPVGRELSALALNALVTIVTEATGYVHSAALRTSLAQKGLLRFNSNLRLFKTGGRWWSPNGAVANTLYAITTVVAYTSASFVFAFLQRGVIMVSWLPVFVLGLCVFLQALLAGWAYRATKRIIWTSSPLEMTATCESMGLVARRPGRCMVGVSDASGHERQDGPVPMEVRERQVSAWTAHRAIRRVVIGVWLVTITGAIWFLTCLLYIKLRYRQRITNWSPLVSYETTSYIGAYFWRNDNFSESNLLFDGLVVGLAQCLLTLALHCCELVVTLSRDEAIWRQASSAKGTKAGVSPLRRALSSWQSLPLLVMKTVCHWFFGLALSLAETTDQSNAGSLQMRPVQIFYLTLAFGLVSLFVTWLALRRPRGPQPAAYGSLQTLCDLVDEWPRASPRLFWGFKEGVQVVAGYPHAGTSEYQLPALPVKGLYA